MYVHMYLEMRIMNQFLGTIKEFMLSVRRVADSSLTGRKLQVACAFILLSGHRVQTRLE